MTAAVSHDEERRFHVEFVRTGAEPEYRARLKELHRAWGETNRDFFDGRMVEPHIAVGRTAPRSLGHCTRTTDYGGRAQISLSAGLVFGTNQRWVVRTLPAAGTRRFINDLLLRFTVRQWVMEVVGADERGYRGFGPKFTEQANHIGFALGLGPVVARRRGTDTASPLAHGWPHCVRPAGYYGDDVTERALDLARGGATGGRATTNPSEGILELILRRLDRGRVDDVRSMLRRHLDWVEALRTSPLRPRRRAERGQEDVDGTPLGEVGFDRAWLDWNLGTVWKIARNIRETNSYWNFPILADALEDAGCGDGRILRHLRERMEHGPRCWVLRLLLAFERE